MSPRATPATGDRSTPKRATRPSPVPQAPCLPRETKVDVTKRHACRAKRSWMSLSATPATQSGAAPRATKARPSAPPEQVDVTKCHAKRRWMSPSAMPATQNEGGCRQVPRLPRKVARRPGRPKRATRAGGCQQVPRLPRETKVDVTKRHACHAKRRWMSPSATPATQSGAAPRATKARPSAPPEQVEVTKFHACHAKRRWMSPSARPATQKEAGCRQVPRLPRSWCVEDGVGQRWCVKDDVW